METAKLKAAVAVLKTMSMKAGTYIRDASVKTADAVNEGTKSLRESKFGATAGETVSSIGTRAAEGSTYVYNVTKTTAQGVVGRFAGAGIPAECAREGRCVLPGVCLHLTTRVRDLHTHLCLLIRLVTAERLRVRVWYLCAVLHCAQADLSTKGCLHPQMKARQLLSFIEK